MQSLAAHRKSQREGSARYRARHPERVQETNRRMNARNPRKSQEWISINREQSMVTRSRANAKANGYEHTITEEDIYIPDVCPVLGIELTWGGDRQSVPSLDRIDNNKGYVPGNVVVISWRANWLKSNATMDELQRIVNFYIDLLEE